MSKPIFLYPSLNDELRDGVFQAKNIPFITLIMMNLKKSSSMSQQTLVPLLIV